MTALQHTILSILTYTQEHMGSWLQSLDYIHGKVCGYDWQGAVQRHGPTRQSVLQCLQRMEGKKWVARSRAKRPGCWCIQGGGQRALTEWNRRRT